MLAVAGPELFELEARDVASQALCLIIGGSWFGDGQAVSGIAFLASGHRALRA